MNQGQTEIMISKSKCFLFLLASLAFIFVLYRSTHNADTPVHNDTIIYLLLIPCGIGVLNILYLLFDTKPKLIIDDQGLFDNSSSISAKRIIPWDRIVRLRILNNRASQAILVELTDPEQFLDELSIVKKALMWPRYLIRGTPISISCNLLNCNTNKLYNLIIEKLELKGKK